MPRYIIKLEYELYRIYDCYSSPTKQVGPHLHATLD